MDELQPGDRLADVRAHIGVYTIAAARRGAVVTSYEPNPQTAALLRRNIQLNGVSDRVTVEEVAVAASSESLRLVPGGTLNIASNIDPQGTPVRATT